MEEVKVVKIFTSQDNLQAEMILDTLKQNGIPAYKKDADESGFTEAIPCAGKRSMWRRRMRKG